MERFEKRRGKARKHAGCVGTAKQTKLATGVQYFGGDFLGTSSYTRRVSADVHQPRTYTGASWHNRRAGAEVRVVRRWALATSESFGLFRGQYEKQVDWSFQRAAKGAPHMLSRRYWTMSQRWRTCGTLDEFSLVPTRGLRRRMVDKGWKESGQGRFRSGQAACRCRKGYSAWQQARQTFGSLPCGREAQKAPERCRQACFLSWSGGKSSIFTSGRFPLGFPPGWNLEKAWGSILCTGDGGPFRRSEERGHLLGLGPRRGESSEEGQKTQIDGCGGDAGESRSGSPIPTAGHFRKEEEIKERFDRKEKEEEEIKEAFQQPGFVEGRFRWRVLQPEPSAPSQEEVNEGSGLGLQAAGCASGRAASPGGVRPRCTPTSNWR